MTIDEAITKLANAEYAEKYQGDKELTQAQIVAFNCMEMCKMVIGICSNTKQTEFLERRNS